MSGCSRAFLLVVLGLFYFSSVLAHDSGLHQGVIVNVQSVTPTQTHFRGKDIVTITGFGFRTYSKVQCIWDSQFASFSAVIVDDRTIQCETPVIDKSEFVGGVPHISSLALIFDGTDDLIVDVTDSFVFGPSLTSFTPSTGKVAGGGTFTIVGSFFSDFTDVSVWFDTTQCAGAKIRSDTQITCTIPSGEFNQNAAISVIFDNDPNLYLHFPTTYHYGPEITVVVPPCGNYAGGTRVTMVGNNFDDPVVSANAAPLLVAPIIEVVYNNKRYFGTDVSFDGQQIQWTTPQIDQDVFGQDVDVYVHFKGVNSKVSQLPVFSFRYGPIVYNQDHLPPFFNTSLTYQNPFPSSGHRSGGDIIVIEGCGFSSFTTGQISPLIYTGVSTTRELCFRGPNGPGGVQDTLTITNCGANSFGCERLLCFTAPFDCTDSGSLDHQLEVRFRPTTGGVFQSSYVLPPADEAELFFAQGPIISSIDKVRGPWNGGQNVTVFGDNFFSNGFTGTPAEPGWTITAILDSPDLDDPLTAPVKVLSDEKMSFITPAGLFGLDVSVTFNFDTCTNIPRNGSLAYHFGPSCSSLQPTNDWLSGNRQVGVSGVGFLEDGLHTAANINVEVCLNRLNADGGVCDVHEPVARNSITATGTSVVFTTPPLRQNVPTNVGGNRLFGDKAGIYVVFENVPGSSLLEGDDEARLYCGDYRFGPVVSSLTPNKGPVGPRGDKSPGTKVTIAGTAFNDPEYNKNLAVGIYSGNFVNEGLIFGGDARVDGVNDVVRNKQITFTTRWGGESNTDVGVVTFFDTCNTTVSTSTVSWGPVIRQLVGPDGRIPLAAGNADLHLYGLLPEGGQDIQVLGEGFDEFASGEGTIDAQCYIDGVPVPTFYDEDDDSIHCEAPARDFNTTAILAIEFGRICNSEEEDIDFKQRIVATQKLIYSPRILDFSPTYGLTSGGTTVVIDGEGFNGWGSYICYFGHYTNGVEAVISDDGRTVTCDTPIHRGEFNTDVTVHVQLGGVFGEKAVAARKFHYGPICTDITPDNDVVLGGRAANLVGDGFIDCTYEEDAPFTNCTFTTFEVRFGDISNGKNANASITNVQSGTVGVTIPSTLKGCQDEPTVALYFPDVVVTNESQRWVVCSNPARPYFFHYGPLFVSQSSEFHRNSISYGWENTEVTITGQNFQDPSLGAPNCLFGGRTATVVSVTDTTIICGAPANDWNALVNVTVEFPSSGNLTGCLTSNKKVLVAQKFHYGPVIDAISPEFGYVAGDDPVEITGFAFGCCGITQWNCMFPQPANSNFTSYPTTRSGDSVTCNVPENDAIDLVLNNIGVFFTGPNFAANFSYQTLTEANTSLHYYYGPIVTRVTPTRASLSARDDVITFEGFGFTDPYLDAVVFCDYFSVSAGGFNDTQVASAVTDTSITCPIATFNHRCGAIDKVRPRWTRGNHTQLRPNFGSKYVKTEAVTPQPPRRVLPFTSDGGSNRESTFGPINYGPAILSVTAQVGQLPSNNPSGSLRSWTQGGLQLEVEFDDIQDWYSGEDTKDFGKQIALCVFGNRGAISFSAIEEDDNTISCAVPSGAFGDSGAVRVILDPHFDIGTTFSPALHSDYWHWMPYVEGVSRRFVTPLGYETVVISGSGFCNYDTVVCNFGGVEGYQGDVVNDYFVLCSTPRRGPGDAPITLDFCDDAFCDNDLSGPLSSENTISVPGNFTVAGITDIQPREGPKCGGTTLHISGYGFHLFDSVVCRFDGDAKKERTGRVVNANTIECLTVDFSPYSDTDPVTCVTVEVVGHFPKLGDILMRSPFTFELGAPNTISVNPASAWLERSSEVVVIGEYLNGGATPDEGGVYFCKFGDFPQVPASIHRFEEDDEEEHSALVCDSPTIFDNPDMKIGTYDLEIYFDCFEGKYTFNRLPFTFYQTPSISRYTPFEGPEVGGTLVTVEGDFLAGGSGYFCSFGTLNIDNQIVGAIFDPINNEIVCYSPAKIVKQSTLVDFAISIDGGATWVTANSPYRYNDIQVVCEKQEDAASSLSPSMIALLSTFFFAAFMAMML